MREWASAAELAGKPGQPQTSSAVIRAARATNVPERTSKTTEGPGRKSVEFLISALPAETRAALTLTIVEVSAPARAGAVQGARHALFTHMDAAAAHNRRVQALKQVSGLDDRAQARMDARISLLQLCERYRDAHGCGQKRAEFLFADAYSTGKIAVDPTLHDLIPTVSAASLQNWRKQLKREGVTRLAGEYGNRRGSGKIDTQPDVRDFIVGMLVRTPHARATHIMGAIRAHFKGADITVPHIRSLERWLEKWKSEHTQAFAAITNPDDHKSRYAPAFGSASAGILRLNQEWEMDSSPADVMLTDGRHSIIGVIDVYSRRVKFLVSKTSTSAAIAALVRAALLDWGVPEAVRTDNGSDYISHHMRRVFASLEIAHKVCLPFTPEQKPHIERAFGTLTRDLFEQLPGYIGHSVAERKAIESRKSFAHRLGDGKDVITVSLNAEELQRLLDRWCEDIYHHNTHRGLGRAPFEMVAGWRGELRRVDDERALDILLAPAPGSNGMRTAQKKGLLIDNAWFIAPELEAFIGQQVQVLELPDLGQVVVKGGPDLQFICIAVCPERTGADRAVVAAKAREMRRSRQKAELQALRQVARAITTDEVLEEVLVERGEKAGKVAVLPTRATHYDSAGLRAAADAAAELDRPTRTTADLMSAADYQEARARLTPQPPSQTQPVFNTPFERAYWISDQARARELTDEEREYVTRFRKENPRSARNVDELLVARYGGNKNDRLAAGS